MTTPLMPGRRRPRPNLRRARERRGWSQIQAAMAIRKLGIKLGYPEDELGVDDGAVSRWERGVKDPSHRYSRIMVQLYGMTPDELDLAPESVTDMPRDRLSLRSNATLVRSSGAPETAGPLNTASLLTTPQASVFGYALTPSERSLLTQLIGRSIESAWRLFHISGADHMYSVARTQLHLVRSHSTEIDAHALPIFFSAAYRLLGATHHRRGNYPEALRTHNSAYLAALEAGDSWSMAQCRSWQAYGLQALGQHVDSLLMTEAALRLISERGEPECLRLRGRLLTSGAMNAATLHDKARSSAMLQGSAELLDQLDSRNEEFDRAVWLESAGVSALRLGQQELAVTRLQEALNDTPPEWVPRRVFVTIGLATALVRNGERDAAIVASQSLMPQVREMQWGELRNYLLDYLHTVLVKRFPKDQRVIGLVADAGNLSGDD